MIGGNHDLSFAWQAKVPNISRASVYYKPRLVLAEDLAIMRRLDDLHLDYPLESAERRGEPDVARLAGPRRRFDRPPTGANVLQVLGRSLDRPIRHTPIDGHVRR